MQTVTWNICYSTFMFCFATLKKDLHVQALKIMCFFAPSFCHLVHKHHFRGENNAYRGSITIKNPFNHVFHKMGDRPCGKTPKASALLLDKLAQPEVLTGSLIAGTPLKYTTPFQISRDSIPRFIWGG